MEAYWNIVEQLEMYCCPRCMAVETGDVRDWECVIVNEVTDLIDAVCPRCVTEYDLSRPELAERLADVDDMIRTTLLGDAA